MATGDGQASAGRAQDGMLPGLPVDEGAYARACAQLVRTPRRWLVTGVAGFIGSHLLETLLQLGQQVRGLDNFMTGHRHNLEQVRASVGEDAWRRFTFIEGDIRDPQACARACGAVTGKAAMAGGAEAVHIADVGDVDDAADAAGAAAGIAGATVDAAGSADIFPGLVDKQHDATRDSAVAGSAGMHKRGKGERNGRHDSGDDSSSGRGIRDIGRIIGNDGNNGNNGNNGNDGNDGNDGSENSGTNDNGVSGDNGGSAATQAGKAGEAGKAAAVDYVLHQAALGSVSRSLEEPLLCHAVNVSGFLNMLAAARDAGVKRFVYAASSATYGDHPDLPKVEQHIGAPLSPYALSKYVNELYAHVYARCYATQAVGLRYFNVFGPRQDPLGAYAAVIPRWIAAMLARQPVQIHGDGATSRDFCYVRNAVQANILAATCSDPAAVNQVYNVAVNARTSLSQLHATMQGMLQAASPQHLPLAAIYGDFRAGDVRHSQADIAKAARLLGYVPTHDLAQGLQQTIAWYLAQAGRACLR